MIHFVLINECIFYGQSTFRSIRMIWHLVNPGPAEKSHSPAHFANLELQDKIPNHLSKARIRPKPPEWNAFSITS